MDASTFTDRSAPPRRDADDARRHRGLMRRTLLHLLAVYFLPLVLLSAYFHVQALSLHRESRRNHLQAMAEHQARMLDLFIRERAVDLSNLIDRPDLGDRPTPAAMEAYLAGLKRNSGAFVDLGFLDESGDLLSYAGPFPVLEGRSYRDEPWFAALRDDVPGFVITDNYLGFRQRPHFTIAVDRRRDGRFLALRATLDPDRIYDYITAALGAEQVLTSTVNRDGVIQVVTPDVDALPAESAIVPPSLPRVGVASARRGDRDEEYGYAWLVQADWAIITRSAGAGLGASFLRQNLWITLLSAAVCLVVLAVALLQARRLVRDAEEREQTRLQLVHSAKLASVGELAGGIAHEINNPLAIISEEAGLIIDLMDPAYGGELTADDLAARLGRIRKAVFRCRDITRKLLGFVRHSGFRLEETAIPPLVDEVVEGFFLHDLELSDIEVTRDYADDLPPVTTDAGQLEQVLINLLTNAADAISGPGRIDIAVTRAGRTVRIAVRDSGCGMDEERMQRIFLPFFTSKANKGTGLGLSVSSGIIEGLGGSIEVETAPGRGSTFTVVLPA